MNSTTYIMKRTLTTTDTTTTPVTSLVNVTGGANIPRTSSARHVISYNLPIPSSIVTKALETLKNSFSYDSPGTIDVHGISHNLLPSSSLQTNGFRNPIFPQTSFLANLEENMNLSTFLHKNKQDTSMGTTMPSPSTSTFNVPSNPNNNVAISGTINNTSQPMNQFMLPTNPIPTPEEKLLSTFNWINALPSTSSSSSCTQQPMFTKPIPIPEGLKTEKRKKKVVNGSGTQFFESSQSIKPTAIVPGAHVVSILRARTIAPDLNATTLSPVTPTATPPHPPNWYNHLEDTELSLLPFKLFPISSNSSEYTTLEEMLKPLQVTAIEQTVNPTLWSRFVNTRKEMLLSKSDDLELLLKLGCDERAVMRSAHVSINFEKDDAVAAYPYNDNVALLFHCTRSFEAVDSILSQGLDERLGKTNGLLGRGIYFSDDPKKSTHYDGCHGIIFVFAVILGDCLSVNHLSSSKRNFVKEPEKSAAQKRNFNDFNFDSIYASTLPRNGSQRKSEYVVYNRYQCCPLYKIQYNRRHARHLAGDTGNQNGVYLQFRNQLPPFSWKPEHAKPAMPNILANTSGWPFYAETIFAQMNHNDVNLVEKEVVELVPESDVANQISENRSINEKLGIMLSLGLNDTELNLETLINNDYNADVCVNLLLDQNGNAAVRDQQSALEPVNTTNLTESHAQEIKTFSNKDILNSASCSKTNNGQGNGATHQFPQSSECSICCNEYEITPANWSILQCSHKLCVHCYNKIETTRTTMAGVQHTFIKCPFCLETSGIEIGTCPNGTMMTLIVPSSCAGYEGHHTISIMYYISDANYKLTRKAYLPDNDEGRKISHLLRIAWDRRLCFSIGTSGTSGRQDVLVWNIHHKTARHGGIERHGFPDNTYLDRVKSELKVYCIE